MSAEQEIADETLAGRVRQYPAMRREHEPEADKAIEEAGHRRETTA
jgi:hypothetical protein